MLGPTGVGVLYARDLLTLFDAIRSGQARERNAARDLLEAYFS